MATIRFVPADTPTTAPSERSRKRDLHPGDDGYPQLFELEVSAGAVTPAHAHTEDEIIYVLVGSLIFGSAEHGAGSSILVPKNTLYQFRAGAAGCTYLNFRPRRAEVISKDAFVANRSR